ncbi:dnaJ homolog subfamily C member 21-like [Lecanosticta acicola]|uniref:DnaJ homolog subfamily C member 21-like n=1 Tax=Lecanosticta acicola TaxID=111012 RepID=A0AAI8YZK4_9PEZI|nr:dnaJ homolog subfamily C member 21-like [Lecanosticta acicola]
MGQSHSSANDAAGSADQDVKTSYYVLLGIERAATEEEIKKAYRRKALELHPDRNYGNEEAATKTFAEVQAAYEVLSDPQERGWYDSHESAILRGDDGGEPDAPTYENVRVTTADDLARLVRKFNSNVEFSDSPSGFFGYIRETFEQLAKEEEIAANWEDVDVLEYPSFGHKDDQYDDVVKRFYSAWSGFSTVKSFAWRDKYRLSEAPDRWYRRRMEQENQRLRKEGKQEFTEAVRSLVAFVRKRDPRYVPNTQSEAERQKTLRDAAASQAARARAANAAKLATEDVPEWTKVRDPEELEESEEEEEDEEVFECVACDKIFKSERQWEAHEKSKKHQKAVKALQHKMRKQNAHLDLEEEGVSSGITIPDTADEEEQRELDDLVAEVDGHDALHSSAGQAHEEELASEGDADQDIDDVNNTAEDDAREGDTKTPGQSSEKSEDESNSEDEDYASLSTIQARMSSATLDTPPTAASEISADDTQLKTLADGDQPSKSKMGKAAQKRAKKAAAAANQVEAGHKCQLCHEEFPSRTRLFAHIEEEGHAALKSATSSGGGGKKKGKGKR